MSGLPSHIHCPGCGHSLSIAGAELGQKARCQHCQCKFLLSENLEILEPPATRIPAPAPAPAPIASANPFLIQQKKKKPIGKLVALGLITAGGFFAWNHFSGKDKEATDPVNAQLAASESAAISDNYREIEKRTGIRIIAWNSPPSIGEMDGWVSSIGTTPANQLIANLRTRIAEKIPLTATLGDLKSQAEDHASVVDLMRHEILRLAGPQTLDEITKRPQGIDFLRIFFSSPEYMQDWLMSEQINDKASGGQRNALHHALTIFSNDKRCWEPLYWKLACAYAKSNIGDWNDPTKAWSLMDCYQTHLRLHQEGRLHASFDHLDAWEMVMVSAPNNNGYRSGDHRHMEAHAYGRHCRRSEYSNACWEIPWVGTNKFGDSCQNDNYYTKWNNEYVRGAEMIRKVWGVCGTLSTYGADSARIHGIPSFPVGQPGHCAYMLRWSDREWMTPYSVTWPTNAKSSFGLGDESIINLVQAAHEDLKKYWRASIHAMQRQFILERNLADSRAEKVDQPARLASRLRVEALPLDLNGWNEIIADTATNPATNQQEVSDLANSFAKAMENYPQPMLNLFKVQLAELINKHFTNDRCKIYLSALKQISPNSLTGIGAHFPIHLEWMSKNLQNDDQRLDLFRNLTDHYSQNPAESSQVVAWGSTALLSQPTTAKKASTIIASTLSRNGDKNVVAENLSKQLIEAADKEDFKRWHILHSMIPLALPAQEQPTWRMSNSTVDGKMPAVRSYPGKLLSTEGIIKPSSIWNNRTVLSYLDAISNKREGGMIHTGNSADANITLILPGKAKLTGISLVNRFDNCQNRALPLLVEVSADAKEWQQIYTSDKLETVWEIDLAQTLPEAKYIRVRRSNDHNDYLNFRAFRVWGDPLY